MEDLGSFLADLKEIAPSVGGGHYAFARPDGGNHGWAQLILDAGRRVTLHRLWTLSPGGGDGTTMLRALCHLADKHRVEIALKPLPFGRKPYPLSRQKLADWYRRHGFDGSLKKMIRLPRTIAA